jgi:hypothetical protein
LPRRRFILHLESTMSKKQEFLRDEQNRDKHPERIQAGSPTVAADAEEKAKPSVDQQAPGEGKVANDRNKMGEQTPTQLNQGRRTPESRNDRQTLGPGPQNQVSARTGGSGSPRSSRGTG